MKPFKFFQKDISKLERIGQLIQELSRYMDEHAERYQANFIPLNGLSTEHEHCRGIVTSSDTTFLNYRDMLSENWGQVLVGIREFQINGIRYQLIKHVHDITFGINDYIVLHDAEDLPEYEEIISTFALMGIENYY